MSLRVVVRAPAETDLLESALYIAEDNPAAAERFLDEAEKAFARLAEFPEIGTPRTAFDPTLAGLRLWPVTGACTSTCGSKSSFSHPSLLKKSRDVVARRQPQASRRRRAGRKRRSRR